MKRDREPYANRRLEYHWAADRASCLRMTSLIYDGDGRVVGIDYRAGSPEEAMLPVRKLPRSHSRD